MIKESKINNFSNWLQQNGYQLLSPTNEYEILRFVGRMGTGVIYTGKRGLTVNTRFVLDAYDCFISGKRWSGKGKTTKRTGGSRVRRQLIDRDGRECFYCGLEMADDDMTVEHLIPIASGGSDGISNKALAHGGCNKLAGCKPLIEKIELRESLRKR